MKRIVILSYVPVYNRQGYDLVDVLRANKVNATLLQLGGVSDEKSGVVGIRLSRPRGWFHSFYVALNLLRFMAHSLFVRKDVVVCIGRASLVLGGLYKKLLGCMVVYYALEYQRRWSRIDRWIITHCVDKWIDVEQNRLSKTMEDLRVDLPAIVVHNMPRVHAEPHGGKLRRALAERYGCPPDAKIAIYAGSRQVYSCLDVIARASDLLPMNSYVVAMAFGLDLQVPAIHKRFLTLPPVRGDAFYEWLADADVALLPYESTDDFNVQNCSPQKIFDCYLAGVPYVASKRPIISTVLALDPTVGTTCDFTNACEVASSIDKMMGVKAVKCKDMMMMHMTKLNYDHLAKTIVSFLGSTPNCFNHCATAERWK